MSTFFISDTHFGDERILRYESRPFETVQQMDDALIENWNRVVGDTDTVFHLGDVSAYDFQKTQQILSALNGKKILVMGNHDNGYTVKQWEEMGFYQAIDYHIIYRDFFMLSHMPLYVCQNMPYANIYGHVHANPSYKDVSRQSACVCVERIDYTPIEWETLRQKMLQLP